MLQFVNVLVPLDFSDKNGKAIDVALELAKTNTARVTLLHVIESIDLSGDTEVDDFVEDLQQQATEKLEEMAEPFRTAGVEVDTVTRFGNRAREIATYENEKGIDLIVVSSHPIDEEHPARSLATMSYQIAVLANCNVMLVK